MNTEPKFTPPSTDRRGISIRLPRPLWILLAAVGVMLAAILLRLVLPIHRAEVAIEDIRRAGGWVERNETGPPWVRELIGEDRMQIFDEVSQASLAHQNVSDLDLVHLRWLDSLYWLSLAHTPVTDAALPHLKKMIGLVWIGLSGTQVSPVGIAELQRALPNARIDD